jgi:hypothetical protein
LNISNIRQEVSKNGAMAKILYQYIVLFNINVNGITSLRCWPGLVLHPFGAHLHKLEAATERSGVMLRERIDASTRVAFQQSSRQIERNA